MARGLFNRSDSTAVVDRHETDETTTERLDAHPEITRREPVTPVSPAPETTPVLPTLPEKVVQPAHTSIMAVLGLVVGLAGVGAAFTGLLAPVAVALGIIGALLALGGVAAGGRAPVAGRGHGAFAVLVSVAAIVFGVLAMTHTVSWLDSNVDEVARLRDWLNVQMPWMKSW